MGAYAAIYRSYPALTKDFRDSHEYYRVASSVATQHIRSGRVLFESSCKPCNMWRGIWFLCFHASSYMCLLGPAWCKLFSVIFITLFARHVSDVIHIHPQERYIMYMQMIQVSARARALTCTICIYIIYRSWGWMCITSETCRANSVIKIALNNLHQAGPSKPIRRYLFTNNKSSLQLTRDK